MDQHRNFEDRLAELVARIDECPPEARESLEAMVTETRERQARNTENITAAREGLKKLELTEQLAAMNLAMVADSVEGLRSLQG